MRAGASIEPRGDETAARSPLGDAELLGVLGAQLDPGVGRGGLQLGRAAGLGPRVEVVDDPAGGQPERVLVARPRAAA